MMLEPKVLLLYDFTRGVDVGTKNVMFELVRDPWLPAVYTGIIMMVLGAICLFVNAQKRKEEDAE